MIQDKIDAAAQGATYGGAGSAVFFGLQANEFAALVGATVAVLGFVVQLLHVIAKERRARELHRAELEALKNGVVSSGKGYGQGAS